MHCAQSARRAIRRVYSFAMALATVLVLASQLLAASPIITRTQINYLTAPNQLTIFGQSFSSKGVKPIVLLNGASLNVLSFTATTIVASMPDPALPPGTYILTVKASTGIIVTFGVKIGATGATGATGPTGAAAMAGTHRTGLSVRTLGRPTSFIVGRDVGTELPGKSKRRPSGPASLPENPATKPNQLVS